MKSTGKPPAPGRDWAAVRADYEAGVETIAQIALTHGIPPRTIEHRRQREGWPLRRDLMRAREVLAVAPRDDGVNWVEVKREYVEGHYCVRDICTRHGIGERRLYHRQKQENWEPRRAAYPKAYGAGGTVQATARLTALVDRELDNITQRLAIAEKTSDTPDVAEKKPARKINDGLRQLHSLASAVQKVLDIEHREKPRHDANTGNQPAIDEASRMALAERLEALASQWTSEGDSGGA